MFEKIQALLAEQMNLPLEKITPESRMLEDLGADSLDFVEMLMTVEDRFGVTIPDDEAANLKTVGDVANYIERNSK